MAGRRRARFIRGRLINRALISRIGYRRAHIRREHRLVKQEGVGNIRGATLRLIVRMPVSWGGVYCELPSFLLPTAPNLHASYQTMRRLGRPLNKSGRVRSACTGPAGGGNARGTARTCGGLRHHHRQTGRRRLAVGRGGATLPIVRYQRHTRSKIESAIKTNRQIDTFWQFFILAYPN